MLNSWPEENVKVRGMSSVDWENAGSLVQNRIFSGTAWHHLQSWLFKRMSKECFPSSENFQTELQFGFNFQSSWDFRDRHVCMQSRTIFSEVAGSWSIKKKNVHDNKFVQNRGPSEKVRYVY